jgi:hypothetical protein
MVMKYLVGFLRRGPISPWVHGTLDYPLAAVLIAGPLLLDFDSDTATIFVLAIGGAATVLAVGTNWSHGIVRVIPPVLHGMLDIGATVFLIAAPFIFGFEDQELATVFCTAVGGAGLLATLLTRFESDLEPAVHPARATA